MILEAFAHIICHGKASKRVAGATFEMCVSKVNERVDWDADSSVDLNEMVTYFFFFFALEI